MQGVLYSDMYKWYNARNVYYKKWYNARFFDLFENVTIVKQYYGSTVLCKDFL